MQPQATQLAKVCCQVVEQLLRRRFRVVSQGCCGEDLVRGSLQPCKIMLRSGSQQLEVHTLGTLRLVAKVPGTQQVALS